MPGAAVEPEPPIDAVYRAWRAAQVDPDLAYEATEQVRAQAGRNVIAVMESRFAVVESRFAVVESRFDVMEARFDELGARIDTLQKVLWPLVIAVCVTLLSAVAGGLFALFKS